MQYHQIALLMVGCLVGWMKWKVEMPKRAKELGALEVSKLKTEGMHAVGTVPGLYLLVAPTGARSWILRVKVGSRRPEMGLGAFPAITLADAREKARKIRAEVEDGKDPIEERRTAASALKASQVSAKTFEECARAYIEAHKAGWTARHAQQWVNTLVQHVFPQMGAVLARHVETPQVLGVLEPIWRTTTETAARIRNRIELVLDWAAAKGYRDGLNPARWRGHLDKLLPKPSKVSKTKNYAAVEVHDAGKFIQDLRAVKGTSARALEFLMLTAVRSANVRQMTWQEVDLARAIWTIPGDQINGEDGQRMKSGREHRVPLSPEAISLLEALPKSAESQLCFWAPRGGVLSDMALNAHDDGQNASIGALRAAVKSALSEGGGDGERMDLGAARSASGNDQELEAVAQVHRPTKRSGKGSGIV